MEDLVTQLTEKFDTRNVVTTYMYLGKENEILNEFLDTFKNADYKYENDQRKRDFWKASLKVHNDPGKVVRLKKIQIGFFPVLQRIIIYNNTAYNRQAQMRADGKRSSFR